MSYSFRIRFELPAQLRIGIDSDKWLLTPFNSIPEITLQSKNQGSPIKDVKEIVMRGDGYASEEEARAEGEQLKDVLILAFARLRIGADFGDRAPKGIITNFGLQIFEQNTGKRFLNDIHGLMTFETEPSPHFVACQVNAVITTIQEKFVQAITLAFELRTKLRPEDRLAFDLFSASFSEPSADARLLMLMMAVETLLNPSPRSKDAQQHINELIRLTNDSSILTEKEKQSLTGSLQWLYNESISQAGRKLAGRLDGQSYLNMKAKDFFTYCYDLRSKLVHGYLPRPTREEVGSASAHLESFVGDLLSGPLLEQVAI